MSIYGDARVSTRTQDVASQIAQLRAAGVDEIRTETSSGAGRRPILNELLEQLHAGDMLTVTALDRLGRVGRSLLELVDDLGGRSVGEEMGLSTCAQVLAVELVDPKVTGFGGARVLRQVKPLAIATAKLGRGQADRDRPAQRTQEPATPNGGGLCDPRSDLDEDRQP